MDCACKACRSIPRSMGPPYSWSPTNGCPAFAKCTRIWWVRPVFKWTCTNVWFAKRWTTLKLVVALCPPSWTSRWIPSAASPSGWLKVPFSALTTPSTSARYVFLIFRWRTCSLRRLLATWWRATRVIPLVNRSNRVIKWGTKLTAPLACQCPLIRLTKVSVRLLGPGTAVRPAGLLTTNQLSSS